jgi:hypothetical protein
MQNLTCHVGRILASKEQATGRHLIGLTSPGHVLAELPHFVCRKTRWDERSPDRTWCHGIDPDPVLYKLLGERSDEGYHRALGRGIVDEGDFRRRILSWCRSKRFRPPAKPATEIARPRRAKAGCKYPSSGGSILRFTFICQRIGFPTGTRNA